MRKFLSGIVHWRMIIVFGSLALCYGAIHAGQALAGPDKGFAAFLVSILGVIGLWMCILGAYERLFMPSQAHVTHGEDAVLALGMNFVLFSVGFVFGAIDQSAKPFLGWLQSPSAVLLYAALIVWALGTWVHVTSLISARESSANVLEMRRRA